LKRIIKIVVYFIKMREENIKSEKSVVIETRPWKNEYIYNFITWYDKGSYLIPYFYSEKKKIKKVKRQLL